MQNSLQTAFGISDEDVQAVMTEMLGLPCDDALAERLRGQLDLNQAAQSALMGDDLETQTTYAQQDLRDQLVAKGLADQLVAGWVQSALEDDFAGAAPEQQQEWRNRWVDAHPFEAMPTTDTLLAP